MPLWDMIAPRPPEIHPLRGGAAAHFPLRGAEREGPRGRVRGWAPNLGLCQPGHACKLLGRVCAAIAVAIGGSVVPPPFLPSLLAGYLPRERLRTTRCDFFL